MAHKLVCHAFCLYLCLYLHENHALQIHIKQPVRKSPLVICPRHLFSLSILHPSISRIIKMVLQKKQRKILQVRKIITIFANVKHTLKASWAEGWADTYT